MGDGGVCVCVGVGVGGGGGGGGGFWGLLISGDYRWNIIYVIVIKEIKYIFSVEFIKAF